MTTYLDMYASEARTEAFPSTPSKRKSTVFNSLDQCIDAYTLAEYIQSLNNPNKHRRFNDDEQDMRPVAFVRPNTSLGKPKPVIIRALLDSQWSV